MKENEAIPPKAFREVVEQYPEVADAYQRLGAAVRRAGPLTEREIALVKLAISLGARMEGASHAHARKALAAGVERAALEHVALLACPTVGFPNMMAALGWVRDAIRERSGSDAKEQPNETP
jgi:alkylhydroperoxidase/carboxymuconolactone decarboxylase family protein YurZ